MNPSHRAMLVALLISGCAGPRIVSHYGAYHSPAGPNYRLPPDLSPHSGVDFAGAVGDPVIAPAPGIVFSRQDNHPVCGNGLLLWHEDFGRYTSFCHMHAVSVDVGRKVQRGETIGSIGESGVVIHCRSSGTPCPIVHMELTRFARGQGQAQAGVNSDPLEITVGCFDPAKRYPTDRLVLTYPVKC